MKPFSHRLLHSSLLIVELAFIWVLLWLVWNGPAHSAVPGALGALLVFFIFTAHLIALSLQHVVPRFIAERHTFAVTLCILCSVLLALMLSYGMLISVIYLNPQ